MPVVDDGERSTNIEFRNEIIELFEKYIAGLPIEKVVRVRGSIEERVKQIQNILIKLEMYY